MGRTILHLAVSNALGDTCAVGVRGDWIDVTRVLLSKTNVDLRAVDQVRFTV